VSFKLIRFGLFGGLIGSVALSGISTALAVANNPNSTLNPYNVISDRNVFRLNPPPPPPEPEQKPVDLPKVMLTGFWTVGQRVKVLLAVPSKDAKVPPIYLTLGAGEGDQNLEVVNIRPSKEEVDILNSGTPQTLTVASNSYVSSPPPSAPGRPGGGGFPMPGMPGPGRRGGFPMPSAQSAAPAPMAAAYTGGSAIVVGGGDSTSFGGSPIVSGGASYGGDAPASTAAAQIANSLFSPAQQYKPPVQDTAPPLPPEVQAAGLLLSEKMPGGGPPAPPMSNIGGEGDSGPPAPP
jgi:hypothetical protein